MPVPAAPQGPAPPAHAAAATANPPPDRHALPGVAVIDSNTLAEIPFGERLSDGRIVTASETPRGIACDCICPQCGGALQAHQGEKLAWHFQHAGHSAGCSYGFETGLHKFAKQIIAEQGGVFFPALVANFSGFTEAHKPGRWVKLHNVRLERRIPIDGEFIVPDIISEARELGRVSTGKLGIDTRTVCIEIFVNHETQEAKHRFLKTHNIAAFEIDLSALRWRQGGSLYSCTADVLRDARRYWIWHPELSVLNAALESKVRFRQQIQHKLKDQRRRFSLRHAEQETYKWELRKRRDAIVSQQNQERELEEYELNEARDIEMKRRERERWLRETENFMAQRGLP